jgi:hypothetical protein
MILAILSKPSDAESLLNNLSEADFDLKDVSVIMQDVGQRNLIAKDVGPLQGMQAAKIHDALAQAGVSQDAARRCSDAVASGKVLVAMKVDDKLQKAATEMFTDASAEIIKG